jgi:hypothetical protein
LGESSDPGSPSLQPYLQLEAQNATASFATANDQHWIFETSNGHIWQTVYTYSNGSLASSDLTHNALTRETYAPAAAPASGLSGFATSNDQHWVFETSDGHIWQIVYTYSSGSFGSGDPTSAANAPPAAIGSGLASFATSNDQHWVFETSDGHIWQIVYTYSNFCNPVCAVRSDMAISPCRRRPHQPRSARGLAASRPLTTSTGSSRREAVKSARSCIPMPMVRSGMAI